MMCTCGRSIWNLELKTVCPCKMQVVAKFTINEVNRVKALNVKMGVRCASGNVVSLLQKNAPFGLKAKDFCVLLLSH